MVSRCVIICLMLATLDIPFILEQPASSLMQYHPHFQYLCKRFDIYRVAWLRFKPQRQEIHILEQAQHMYIYIYLYAQTVEVFVWLGAYGGTSGLESGTSGTRVLLRLHVCRVKGKGLIV